MSDVTERLTATIVLVGKFNPAIFSPAWLCKVGIVAEADLEAATLGVIHPDVAVFDVGGYSFDIRKERFAIEVASEPLIRVLDATLIIFDETLPHTPITELGINYTEVIGLDSGARRVALGRALAPLEPWGAWGDEIGSLGGDLTSGMIGLTMIRSYDPKGSGERRVDVQPSNEVSDNRGVYITVNDHRVLQGEKDGNDAKAAMNLIRDSFDGSMASAKAIVDDLANFAMAEAK